jgi:glycosyltransferase involved in cell wall biosynthesis
MSDRKAGRREAVISVIIPCYNESRYIRRCLTTLMDQSLPPHEIIVVDDGSSDGTTDIIGEFNVQLLRQDHAGPAAARNLGVSAATGDILVLVDADMFFDRDYVRRLTEPITAGTAMGTFTKEEFVGNPDNVWAVCWNLETMGNRIVRMRADTPDESDAFRAIRRDLFLRARGYETTVGYEDDTTLAPKLGFPARAASGAICYHNNPSSLREIFHSARWIGRGSRFVARPWKIWKYIPPVNGVFALAGALKYRENHFVIFKAVYDAGVLTGMLSRWLFRTSAK